MTMKRLKNEGSLVARTPWAEELILICNSFENQHSCETRSLSGLILYTFATMICGRAQPCRWLCSAWEHTAVFACDHTMVLTRNANVN